MRQLRPQRHVFRLYSAKASRFRSVSMPNRLNRWRTGDRICLGGMIGVFGTAAKSLALWVCVFRGMTLGPGQYFLPSIILAA
jgi:hypothetical protein